MVVAKRLSANVQCFEIAPHCLVRIIEGRMKSADRRQQIGAFAMRLPPNLARKRKQLAT